MTYYAGIDLGGTKTYCVVIDEKGNILSDEGVIKPDEELLWDLGSKLQILSEHLSDQPEVTFTYFRPDARKSGGSYLTLTGIVNRIDAYARQIRLQDGRRLSMDDVIGIEFEGEAVMAF